MSQLGVILSVQRRFSPEIDTREILKELGERLREELDYVREAAHMRLYAAMLADADDVRVPRFVPELSTKRLLTMTWLQTASGFSPSSTGRSKSATGSRPRSSMPGGGPSRATA